jgi:glycosyltransferase involved in cell wall biosynthesis
VIPAYNCDQYVGESITSTLAQDLAPMEVLVVDDGSTDATAAVAESFGTPVRCIRHRENQGEAAARNTGVDEARGEVIAMHDADDRMLPGRLRIQADRLVRETEADPSVGAVLGQQRPFTHDGSPLPGWMLDADGRPRAYGLSPVLAWRTAYDRVGRYDTSFRMATDTDWLIRARDAAVVVVMMDDVVIERRVHPGSMSQDQTAQRQAVARSLRANVWRQRKRP